MRINHNTFRAVSPTPLFLGAVLLSVGPLASPASAQAQASPTGEKALPPISLDLRDAPIRQALEQLFSSAGVQFSIDNNVAGFVTLKIVDQPFENALKVLLRSSSQALAYTHEGGVYFIKPRVLDTTSTTATTPEPPETTDTTDSKKFPSLEELQLTYADPADLQGILGVSLLRNFQRSGNIGGSNGGSSSGFGSGGIGGNSSGLGGSSGSFGSGGFGGSSGSSFGSSFGGSSGLSGMSGGYSGSSGSRF